MLLLYINQSRLLDICAMENNGFSEYEIYSNESSLDSTKKYGLSAGFKAIALGKVDSAGEEGMSHSHSTEVKKIQTISSIFKNTLEQVKSQSKSEDDLKNRQVRAGDFIIIPAKFHLNSFNLGIEAFDAVLRMYEPIISKNNTKSNRKKSADVANGPNVLTPDVFKTIKQEWEALKEALNVLVEYDEVYCENEQFAIVSTINRECLYQTTLQGIIDVPLNCFAQVKEVRPGSTGLLKNSLYRKIDNIDTITEPLEAFAKNKPLNIELEVASSTIAETIFEVEVIGMYV